MVIVTILVILAILAAIGLMVRSTTPQMHILPALGWIGGVLGVCSLFLLPWVTTGPPGTVIKNAGWVASMTEIIDTIKQIPGIADRLQSVSNLTGESFLAIIEHPVKAEFLKVVEAGSSINGLRLMGIVVKIEPQLTMVIGFAGLTVMVGTLLNLMRLIANSYDWEGASKLISIAAVLSIVMLLGFISSLDTFGKTDEFDLRLLATLAENQVASGCWWMIFGLLLLSISGLLDLVGLSPSYARNNDEETDEYPYSYS